MKKKILFMIINMNIGGTEKALLNMLSEIDKEKYEITVLMLEEYGGFLKDIPMWVNVRYLEGYGEIKEILNLPPQMIVKKLIKQGKFIKGLHIAILHLLYKIKKERTDFFKYVLKNNKVIEEEFDLAVAYAGPMDFISYFVVNKIKAEKKIQWIHFDVTKIVFNEVFANKIYSKFDKIFVVSNEAKSKLENVIPNLKDKIEVFLNIIPTSSIEKMANEGSGFKDDFNGIRILTVGRLAKEKGQDLTIPVLARLKEEGYNVKWYCIGEGNLRGEYEELINKYNIEDNYILLGANSNPYPFMKECDIYVQSSRHEGYCITLGEAKCFESPIVSTNFTGVSEHIKDGETGIIVDVDEDKIYKSIKRLLDDDILRNNIKYNIKQNRSNNTNSIKKLYNFDS